MRNIWSWPLAAIVAGVLPVAAQAADFLPTTKAPPAPYAAAAAYNWSGFYVGASAGLVSSDSKIAEPYYGDHFSATGYGAIGGVDIGYNMQFQSIVVGLEADISGTSAGGNILEYDNEYAAKSTLEGLGTVRARFGYAFDRAMIYATGGFAYGDVADRSNWPIDGTLYNTSTNSWKTGWTAGVGVEYALTANWTVRAEGLYVGLGKQTNYDQYGYGNQFTNSAVLTRVGLNYKF